MPRRAVWQPARRAPAERLRALGVEPLVLAQLLLNRGICDPLAADRFLHAEAQPLGDPELLAGVRPLVDRLLAAIGRGELIAVYGDYDVDGLTGAALLTRALQHLGGQVLPFIPHRTRHGYGLNVEALNELRAQGATVVVTVDCGVTARDEVRAAAQLGLDVLVTDHHHLPQELPAAAAIVNPRQPGCAYPFRDLSGAGVAYTVARALLGRAGRLAELDDELVALAAIGTVADLVPLLGENRTIVRRGLAALNRSRSPGLLALLRTAGLAPGELDADAIGYALAPRINAAGRLAEGRLAFDLLLAASEAEAVPLALRLNALNQERQRLTDESLQRARLEVVETQAAEPVLIVTGEYPAGVVGLVAARLVEEFDRPAVVVERGERFSRGSVRSVAGFSVVEALERCAALLTRWGGHAQAGGLTVETVRLDEFERAFRAFARERLSGRPPTPALAIDCRIRPISLTWDLLAALRRLEPFGSGNPRPVFLTEGLVVREVRALGGGVLRLRLGTGPTLTAVQFRANGNGPAVGDRIDVAYEPRLSAWNGSQAIELRLLDWRPAGEGAHAGADR